MRITRKLGAVLAAAAMAASLAGCGAGKETLDLAAYRTQADGFSFTNYPGETVYAAQPQEEYAALLDGYEAVCESRFLTLYADKARAAVAVSDRRTGRVWFSNTPTIDEDTEIDEDARNLFYAQLLVEYLDGQNFKQIDSYNASVAQGTFDMQADKDGLTVTYHLMDNKTADTDGQKAELFTITLRYALEDESLIVRVPMAEVACPAGILPLKIAVLPHFGGSSATEGGYLLVPDGSGALIEFGSGKYSTTSYVGSVYGFDKSLEVKSASPKVQQVRLPVFGVKDGDDGFLAILEDGAALASIHANRAGPYSSFNEVYASFATHAYQNVSIGAMENASKLIGIQDIAYQGDLRLRYAFLDSAQADYVGMAGYYRQYLTEKDGLQPLKAGESLPFNLELLGAVDKLKSTFGIKYQGMESLTTTEQAIQILEELQGRGITNIQLKYSGWMNGGLRQDLPASLKVESAVGGKKGLTALRDYTRRSNVGLYPAVNFLTTPTQAKGFNVFRMAAMQIDQKDAKAYYYDMVTRTGEDYDSILSPAALGGVAQSFNKAYGALGISGLCLNDMGENLYADYTKGAPIDRETASNIIRRLLKDQFAGYDSLMITGGFAYMMPYADVVLNAPFTDSGVDMTDETVPFYQLVFHGYAAYAGAPLNLSYDFETDLLRLIEYGGTPYFQLMAADGSAVKNTSYSMFCSSSYGIWKDRLVQAYQTVNEALAPVQSAAMTGHRKLAENLYRTDYEGGWSVYVNYGSEPAQADGVTVPARGYSLQQKSAA